MEIVVLDRDSFLDVRYQKDDRSIIEWSPIAGCLPAIARLSQAGILVILLNDQPGLISDTFTISDFNTLQQKLFAQLEDAGGHIDSVFFCAHGNEEACQCKGASDSLLEQVGTRYPVKADEITVVSNCIDTIQLASSLAYHTALLRQNTDRSSLDETNAAELVDNPVCYDSFPDFVDQLTLT